MQSGLKKLEDVDLVENPVTLLEDYKRDAIFEAIPSLKVSEIQPKISSLWTVLLPLLLCPLS